MQERVRLFSRPSFTIMVWAMLDFVSAMIAGFIAFRIRVGSGGEADQSCGASAPGGDGSPGIDCLSSWFSVCTWWCLRGFTVFTGHRMCAAD